MANSRRRCANCRDYYPAETMISVGLRSVCTKACRLALGDTAHRRSRVQETARRSRDEVPSEVREAVLRRDRHRCRWCRTRTRLEVHHVRYRSENGAGLHEVANLLTLCADHHRQAHANKRQWKPVLLALLARLGQGEDLTVADIERTGVG